MKTADPTLRDMVFSNLAAATENGHDFADWSAEDIASDMILYAEDVESHEVADLVPHIEDWLRQRAAEQDAAAPAPVNLAARRMSTNGDAGFEFTCGICAAPVYTAIRHDHFPSCMQCRCLCAVARSAAGEPFRSVPFL